VTPLSQIPYVSIVVVKFQYNNMFTFSSKINTYSKKSQSGFTLVEVLVSMSIFITVVGMSVGTLLVLIDANAKAQNLQSVITNLSFALDSMTREIRTGHSYECQSTDGGLDDTNNSTNDCTQQSNFAFTESGSSLTQGLGSNRIAYRLENETIQRRLGVDSSNNWQSVTAPEITISKLQFVTSYTDTLTDTRSPTVTVFIEGTAGSIVGLDSSFALQTTVTQQGLDL